MKPSRRDCTRAHKTECAIMLGLILGWPRWKAAILAAGIQAVYAYERLGGWRRMVSLRTPARR